MRICQVRLSRKANYSVIYSDPYICPYYIRHNGSILPFFYAGICISIGYRQFSCRICYYRRNTHITCVYNLQIAPKINISANG